jgi:hypothetical protein
MIGVKLSDGVTDEVTRDECGVKKDVVTKIEKNMLRWFGHVKRIDARRLTKEISEAVFGINVVRGRPNWASYRERPVQEYQKPVTMYQEFDESRGSEKCM